MTAPKFAADLEREVEGAIDNLIHAYEIGNVSEYDAAEMNLRAAIDAAVEAARSEDKKDVSGSALSGNSVTQDGSGLTTETLAKGGAHPRDNAQPTPMDSREQAAFRRGAREALDRVFIGARQGSAVWQDVVDRLLHEYADPQPDEKGDLNGLSK